MTTYARINDGVVAEIIEPLVIDGEEISVGNRFHPAFVAQLIDVTNIEPRPECWWTYDGTTFAPPVPLQATPDAIRAAKVATVQAFMDAKAQALNYDDIATAVTYADEPAVPRFQAEGQAFRAWRSLVWAKCYELLAEVQNGGAVPSDEDLIASLPSLELPQE